MSLHPTNNEKERTAEPATSWTPFFKRAFVATDVAVNRVSLFGEAPLTRCYL
jgi:hypothetical protein